MQLSLAEHYQKYFYALKVTTPELTKSVYQLRYNVYAKEFKYLNPEIQQLESDDFDESASHAVLIHRITGCIVGSVRFVPKFAGDSKEIPFFRQCESLIDGNMVNLGNRTGESYGEISRFCVDPIFRRREKETKFKFPIYQSPRLPNDLRYQFPIIPVALLYMGMRLSMNSGIDNVYSLLEPKLHKVLTSAGIDFELVGDFLNYHGRRGPFRMSCYQSYSLMSAANLQLFDCISEEIIRSQPLENLKAS